jgi:AbrB family looped-hinge helix DNA binding protein
MSVRVGERGQVVIPKSVRDQAGIRPGDQVDFEFRDGEVVLVAQDRELASLAGIFGGSGMAQQLLEDRASEPR